MTDSSDVFNAAAYFVDRHVEEGRGAAIAIECGDRRVSYASLHEHVNRTGAALRDELDVRPEERVLLLMLDTPEMVFAFFGAIKIGAVPIPINTLWTASDYEFVLRDSRSSVVIVSEPLHERIAGVIPKCPWVRHVVVVGKDIPQAPPHQLARLTIALDRWILPGRANLLERGLVGPSPASASQRPDVLMEPQRFPMKLLDREMEHGEQGRAFQSCRRDLRENVVTTETERKELREDRLTLAVR